MTDREEVLQMIKNTIYFCNKKNMPEICVPLHALSGAINGGQTNLFSKEVARIVNDIMIPALTSTQN